jgi:hypothetical protein
MTAWHLWFRRIRGIQPPMDPEEISASELTRQERECIVSAVSAVVRRDVEAVRELSYPPWRKDADMFWTWADDYGDRGRLDLVMPPGEIDEWDTNILRMHDGLAVHVEMWAEGVGQTDLTLEMEIYTNADGSPRVELRNMHVM